MATRRVNNYIKQVDIIRTFVEKKTSSWAEHSDDDDDDLPNVICVLVQYLHLHGIQQCLT